MSTILKALRRLERERQPDPSRPLQQDVVAYRPGEPQDAPRRPGSLAVGAAIVLSLGLGVIWLSSGPDGPGAQPGLDVGERTGARAEGPERSTPPAAAPRPAPPVVVRPPAPELEPAPALPSPESTPSSVAVQAASDASPAPADELPYRLPDPAPLAAFEAPAPREEVPEVAGVPMQAAPRVAAPEPAAPPTPAATVESTTWHPDPGRRLARVGMPGRDAVSLREGDALGELVILRIEPAGVVFLYRGREIRQGVGRRAAPAD